MPSPSRAVSISTRPASPTAWIAFTTRFRKTCRSWPAFAAIGAYAVAVSGVTWLVGPKRAWAMEFSSFDEQTAGTLLHMTRALYPHDKVGDVHYAGVVKSLDDAVAAAADADAALALYRDGAARLNQAAGGDFPPSTPMPRKRRSRPRPRRKIQASSRRCAARW
ncbi:MAG: hypothetical protein HC871_12685 [Rhizobiales bacterium]|nr:hypothetical protein [Hyphomicrobiales bacterium]